MHKEVKQFGLVARAKPRVSVTGQLFPFRTISGISSVLYNIQKRILLKMHTHTHKLLPISFQKESTE